MQTAKTKGILLLLLLFTASLLLALGLALPRHTASAQSGVATVNGQTYDSLAGAVAVVSEGTETTITLTADTAESGMVTIPAGKVIVLDLNGNSVSVTGSAAIQNEGTLTIKGASGAVETDAENAIENAGTLKIEGGYFEGGISNTGSVSITGGRFSKLVPASYLAENYSIKSYSQASWNRGYSISNKAPVAEITLDGTRYVFEKISTASDAAAGGTVTLIADAEQTSFITLDTPVTLDLNGYDITYDITDEETVSNNLIKVTGKNVIITNSSQNESKLINQFDNGSNAYSVIYAVGANLTVENVTIESKGIGISATNSDMVVKNSTITSETGLGFGFFGGMTAEEAKTDTANYNTLTLENSSVSGHTFALAGNGTKHGTAVIIQNSTLTGTSGAGIYHPQVGTLTVGGADTKISGTSGIELRAGTLTVSGGEISATAETFEAFPNEAGSTIDGAAIAVSQHGYDPDIAVNITGGTFNGVKALYEEDLQDENVSNISMAVTGGTYEGGVESENVTGFISGGTFSGEVNTDYVASGSVIYSEEGSNVVGSEEDAVAAGAVAVVDNTAYTTLEAAIESATEGDTIQLLQDVTIGTIIAKNSFTLDLNTYEISGGLLYISGSTAADTGIVVSISNGSISAEKYGILINNNAELNLSDVVIESALYGIFVPVEVSNVAAVQPAAVNIQGGSVNGDGSAMVICGVGDSVATPTKLIANGTKFTGGIFGISGNGSAHNTYIELNDCSVTAGTEEGGIGIYHPQKGEIVINGSEITGIDSGIEIRAGELNISGDTVITATATEFSAQPNTNGTTMSGVAVAVSQHTTNLPIAVNITGGTFNGVKALYEEDLQDENVSNISMAVTGGTYEGGVESENVTGFISGGSFKTLPDEVLLGAEYGGVLYNGYYVVVEETTDVGALTVAKLEAQADIRSYSASLGFPWTELSALSGKEKVDAILAAYNAVDAAESEGAVAVARLNALDAIDAYYTYLKGLKETALGEIETYAAVGQDKAAVAVPTYILSAINGAVSKAEIESYVTAAKAEIKEIREQRTELATKFKNLNTKAEDLANDLKTALQAAIEDAVETNANTLAELKKQLTAVETNITTIADIEKLLGTAADEAGNQTLFGKIGALETALQTVQTNITKTVTEAVTGVSGKVDSVIETLETVADSDDIAALTSSLKETKGVVDGLEGSIGTLGEGETIVSILTALQTAQEELAASVAEYHKAVEAALTGEGGIQAQLNELAAAVDALPDNTAAIADLNALVTDVQTDMAKALESLGALDTSVDGSKQTSRRLRKWSMGSHPCRTA